LKVRFSSKLTARGLYLYYCDISLNIDILLFPVSENKGPPYWNSTSAFDFDLFIVIGVHWTTKLHPHRNICCGFM